MTYDQGDQVSVAGVFTTQATAVAVDPTAVLLSVRRPSGKVTTYTYGVGAVIVKDSTGNYHAIIDLDTPGLWYYRWYSTGTGKAAGEGQFQVRAHKAVAGAD